VSNQRQPGPETDLAVNMDSIEFLQQQACLADSDGCPTTAARFRGVIEEVERLRRENEALKTPTCYWNDENPEESAIDAAEVGECGKVGEHTIVKFRPIHELPAVWVLVDDNGVRSFGSREEAEDAAEERK